MVTPSPPYPPFPYCPYFPLFIIAQYMCSRPQLAGKGVMGLG